MTESLESLSLFHNIITCISLPITNSRHQHICRIIPLLSTPFLSYYTHIQNDSLQFVHFKIYNLDLILIINSLKHTITQKLSNEFTSISGLLTFSCLNRVRILISLKVRWQYVWCSNGEIFFIATRAFVRLSCADLKRKVVESNYKSYYEDL